VASDFDLQRAMLNESHDDAPHEPSETTSECREALERLYVYLDGELTESRRDAIRTHLEECSPCLEAFDFEAELKIVVARHCKDRVPDGLRVRVAMAISEASGEEEASK
jgi:mycothiol system anti-sigma-R factor